MPFILVISIQKKSKVKDYLVWTDYKVLLLLETTRDFKSKKVYEEVEWESVKDKNAQILSIFVTNCPKKAAGRVFSTVLNFLLKIWLLSKSIWFETNIEMLQTLGKQVVLVKLLLLFTIFATKY